MGKTSTPVSSPRKKVQLPKITSPHPLQAAAYSSPQRTVRFEKDEASSNSPVRGRLPAVRSQLDERLSFVTCSLNSIRAAIAAADPECTFNTSFWQNVLMGKPSKDFSPFMNRSLAFWVRFYNSWQEMSNYDARNAVQYIALADLQKMTSMPTMRCTGAIKLFEKLNYKRGIPDGLGCIEKVKILVPDLITAGVLLSKHISSEQKLAIVFGIADLNDTRSLSEDEFYTVISSFVRGLSAAFALDGAGAPSAEDITDLAARLYKRISAVSAKRICEIHANSSPEARASLLEAIKARHSLREVAHHSQQRRPQHRLSFSVLWAWCFRELNDPLSLPYALTFERFCPRTLAATSVRKLVGEKFFLKHGSPMDLPEEEPEILTRKEVMILHNAFETCFPNGWPLDDAPLNVRHLGDKFQEEISCDCWTRLLRALQKTDVDCRNGTKADFNMFLKRMCPCGNSKQFRKYEIWYKQYEDLLEKRLKAEENRQACATFLDHHKLPELPAKDLAELEKLFDSIDKFGTGFISAHELAIQVQVDLPIAQTMVSRYDVSEDGLIDKHEFLLMMCPLDYQLPDPTGLGKDLFGELLTLHSQKRRKSLELLENCFDPEEGPPMQSVRSIPAPLWPEVEDDVWTQWNSVFDKLDLDSDGAISLNELKSSGILPWEVCEHFVNFMDHEALELGFSRAAFLSALLQVRKKRRTGFEF